MTALPIPSPPPTPTGDRWVETGRSDDQVYYRSEDGWASISLCLIDDKDGRRWEWTGHNVIVGLDMWAVEAEWERASHDDFELDPRTAAS